MSELLFERAKNPMHIGYTKSKLKELEKQLWEKDLDSNEIIKILNDAFSNLLVRFESTYSNKQSDYGNVGLDGGNFSPSGWITINLTQDIDEVLNGQTRAYYSEFVDLCTSLIGHELKHRDQVIKSYKNLDNIPDTDDVKKYLKDHREIEAYAVQAALELLSQFSKKEIIAKLSSSKEFSNLGLWSEAVKWYTYTFDNGDPILKKFVKKIVEILTEED